MQPLHTAACHILEDTMLGRLPLILHTVSRVSTGQELTGIMEGEGGMLSGVQGEDHSAGLSSADCEVQSDC